ncbi:Predicted arabinose efflux permease, MFS family [Paenibacillus uliginis N3/975]|uniref:Predicted arabinose efflux permease, MFS family n=1 Tax=Paenibacillus uliginis N3/975 TaxID=1313296 RepID=A0A1X7HQ62_9BACL|nr:MFS transporter [Paenibacillus uliginis]SMF89925.1 Predicted arabinose efflux permease, MFS family [Paenibacillus uliginis N3/975]
MSFYIKDLLQLSTGVRRFLISEAFYGVGIGLYTLVLNLHLLFRGLREDEIGALVSTGILIMGVLAIPVSMLANRIGRKKLLVAGVFFIAAGNVLFAVSEELIWFYAAQILVSAGLTLVETTEIQLLFHYCKSRKEEARAYSLMFAVFTAFTGLGTLAAGYIAKGFEGSRGYEVTLLLTALVLVLHGVIRAFWLPTERKRSQEEAIEKSPSGGFSILMAKISSGTLWLFAVFTALLGGSIALTGSFLNVIVKFRLDWMDDQVSLLLAINGIVLFICSLLTPYIMERFGYNIAIISVFVVNILLCVSLYMIMPVWLFGVMFLLRGGGATMLSNLLDSLLMSAFKDEERNLYAGMRSVFRSLGSSLATFVSGLILSVQNYQLPFLATAGALLACGLYYIWWIRPVLFKRISGSIGA